MHNSDPVDSEFDTVSVAVLVDNEVLCRGIQSVLQALPSAGAVHRCADLDEVATLLKTDRPDVLIVAATDQYQVEDAARLVADTGTRILLLVDEPAMNDPSRYATAAVDGFLSQQDLTGDTLRDALLRSRRGELPMPAGLARALLARADEPAQRPRGPLANLTTREVETLALLVRGLSNKQIARRLGISTHGAKRLVANIMIKLDSPNRTTAAVNAIKAGIVDYL